MGMRIRMPVSNNVKVNFQAQLKSVPKVIAHFAFIANIFRNFNAICDFSFAMNSYGHEANFQPKQLRNPLILLSKNEDEKFSVLRWARFLDY